MFPFRRMPFGHCNASATCQSHMMAIFSYMVEDIIDIFIDNFSICGPSCDAYLNNLNHVLERCQKFNLVLNSKKCHLMVCERIVLGHKISRSIEVDKSKVEVIERLPPPNSIWTIRSFLEHVDFYRRFIKDIFKITKPLCDFF